MPLIPPTNIPQGLPQVPPISYSQSPSNGPVSPFNGMRGGAGAKAPSLDGPFSGPSARTGSPVPPASAAPALAGSGSLINPYVAIPAAIWYALFENPGPAGETPQQQAAFEAQQAKRNREPGRPLPAPTPLSPKKNKPLAPKKNVQPPKPPEGQYGKNYRVTFTAKRSGGSPVTLNSYVSISGRYGSLEKRAGANSTRFGFRNGIGNDDAGGFTVLLEPPNSEVEDWSVEINSIREIGKDYPQSPSNPANQNPGEAPSTNPSQKNPVTPNPANQNPGEAPSTNPSQKNPVTPNLSRPVKSPNPLSPNQASSTNPSQKNPVTPNPSGPKLPGPIQPSAPANPAQAGQNPSVTNPSQKNPQTANPGNPSDSFPSLPVSNPGGAIVVSQPGPIIPRTPNPLNPTKQPSPEPCIEDPCAVAASSQSKPVSIVVKQFIGCNVIKGVELYFKPAIYTVPSETAAVWKASLNNQADILAMQCKQSSSDAIAAIPDWWQVRLGADRPQLIVQFAAKFADGTWDKAKYVLSVPHWNKNKELTLKTDFPSYRKGQYQGIMVLPDNSKLIVNAFSEVIARSVVDEIALGIPVAMVENAVTTIGIRRGRALSSVVVYPRVAKYFSTGQQNLTPDWAKTFS